MAASCNRTLARQPSQQAEWDLHMNRLLREVMAGPLQGKKVVFMVDDVLIKNMEGGSVLGVSNTQNVIFSFQQSLEDNSTDLFRLLKPRKTAATLTPLYVQLCHVMSVFHITAFSSPFQFNTQPKVFTID